MLSKENTLDLREGAMRYRSTVHNAGWYNTAGVKIGWGDLDATDFKRIQSKLNPNEMLVVLGEHDSFWQFVTEVGIIGSLSKVKSEEQNPGVQYIIEKARWVIANDMIYLIDGRDNFDYGFTYNNLSRDIAAKLIVNAT